MICGITILKKHKKYLYTYLSSFALTALSSVEKIGYASMTNFLQKDFFNF